MKKRAIIFSAISLMGLWASGTAVAQDYQAVQVAVIDTVAVDDTAEVEELLVRIPGDQPETQGLSDSWSEFTTKYITGGKGRSEKRWKWHSGHWMGVGLYYGGLVKNLGTLSLPEGAEFMKQSAKSIGVNVQFIDVVLVSDRSFGLITGLGMEINNFRFDKNIGLTQNSEGVIVEDTYYNDNGIGLSKSKLTTVYLNIPLLAEFQFGRPNTSWKRPGFVNFGVIAGLLVNGHTKVKSSDPMIRGTFKQNDGLNLRNFHWGAEFNIGYKHIALSGRYYPQSIFSKDQGPKVQQVNIGLSVLF